ncbi:hypothetical protein C8R45DRAFT_942397 [Mycena sanguinolenta]|nr:hypothetical protein C8R45DRAFT_942397 [Mycena sanguinolenta]
MYYKSYDPEPYYYEDPETYCYIHVESEVGGTGGIGEGNRENDFGAKRRAKHVNYQLKIQRKVIWHRSISKGETLSKSSLCKNPVRHASTVKLDASADIVGHWLEVPCPQGTEERWAQRTSEGEQWSDWREHNLNSYHHHLRKNMNHLEDYRDEDEEEQALDQEEKGKGRALTKEVEDDVRKKAVEKAVALREARKAELDQLLTESEKVRSQKEKEMEKWRRQEVHIAQLLQQLVSGFSLTPEEEEEVDSFRPVLVDLLRQPSLLSRRVKHRRVVAPMSIREAGLSNVVGSATDTSDAESESSESSDETEEKEGTKKRKRAGGSKGNAEETRKVKGQLIRVVKDRSYFIHPERPEEAKGQRKAGSEIGGG